MNADPGRMVMGLGRSERGWTSLIDHILRTIASFMNNHTVLFVVIAAMALLLIIRRPKNVLCVLLLVAIIGGILYFIYSAGTSGVRTKERLIQKSGRLPGKE